MSCYSTPQGIIPPNTEECVKLLHEHQLRHHHVQLPEVVYNPAQITRRTTRLKPMYSYYQEPAKAYMPCTRPDPEYCSWSTGDVAKWLKQIGFGRYEHPFALLEIDGKKLENLDAHEIRRMGLRDWKDCVELSVALEQLRGRKKTLNPEDYRYKIYPYHPALYFGEEFHLLFRKDVIHRTARFQDNPEHNDILRHIYGTAGDRFFYFNRKKKPAYI